MHNYYEVTFKIRFSPKKATELENHNFQLFIKKISQMDNASVKVHGGGNGTIVVTSGGWLGVEYEPFETPLKNFDCLHMNSDCIAFRAIVNDGWTRSIVKRQSLNLLNVV